MPPWGRHYPREHCARNATVRAMGLDPQPARYTRASCDDYEDDGYDDVYDDVDEDATYQRKMSNCSRGRAMRQPVESMVSRLRSCLRCSARVFVVVLMSAILLATAPSALMPSLTSSPTNMELQLSPPPALAQLWIQTQATCTPPPGTRVDGNEIRSGDCENLKAVVGLVQRAGRCRYIQRSTTRTRNLCTPH